MNNSLLLLAFCIASILPRAFSQQVADTSYHPTIAQPNHAAGKGPKVFIDAGHHNFHTQSGRYSPFATLLERDGYQVLENEGPFTPKSLAEMDILVISNALHESNVSQWVLPNPSAFTEREIQNVFQWVNNGGALFLIADHMPMAGAATDLAKAFGIEFTNGFVLNDTQNGPSLFRKENGTLCNNLISEGRNRSESVSSIASFTGQGFSVPKDAYPILLFDSNHTNYLPDTAWVFNESTERYNAKGLAQGIYKIQGKGRIVAFGEAALFTAQLAGRQQQKVGMNAAIAGENYQLALNILHWLDGTLTEENTTDK